jgi:hypothetical protein
MSDILRISAEDRVSEYAVTALHGRCGTLCIDNGFRLGKGVRFLVYGDNSPQKCFFRIVHACERLNSHGLEYAVYFFETPLYEKRFRDNIKYYGLSDNCDFAGENEGQIATACDCIIELPRYDSEFLVMYKKGEARIENGKLQVSDDADPEIITNSIRGIYDKMLSVIAPDGLEEAEGTKTYNLSGVSWEELIEA